MDAQRQHALPMSQWTAMLAKSDNMVAQIVADEGTPALERDPAQLESATSRLQHDAMEEDSNAGSLFFSGGAAGAAGGPAGPDGSTAAGKKKDFLHGRASRLLGQYNFDADKLERELHQIMPRATQQAQADVPLDHHLKVITSSVHEALTATVAETEHQALAQLEDDWEAEKASLLDELRRSDSYLTVGATPSHKQLALPATQPASEMPFGHAGADLGPSAADSVISGMDGARIMKYRNTLRNNESTPSQALAAKFREQSCDDGRLPSGEETWKLVEDILTEVAGKPAADPLSCWLRGAQRFLQDQYRRKVINGSAERSAEDTLCSWLKRVRNSDPLHGLGGIAAELRRFSGAASGTAFSDSWDSNGRMHRLNQALDAPPSSTAISSEQTYGEDSLPLWAVVYYFMRAGDWNLAAAALQSCQRMDEIDSQILAVLNAANAGPGAADELHTSLNALERLIQNGLGSDEMGPGATSRFSPWKRALMYMFTKGSRPQLLDRCISASVQDYMWMKLSIMLVQTPKEREGTLQSLQAILRDNGPSHFNDGSDAQLFARLLLMANLPLDALDFLAQRPCPGEPSLTCFVDAVHMAICLAEHLQDDTSVQHFAALTRKFSARLARSSTRDAMFYLEVFWARVSLPEPTADPSAHEIYPTRSSPLNTFIAAAVDIVLLDITRAANLLQGLGHGLKMAIHFQAGKSAYDRGRILEAVELLLQLPRYDKSQILAIDIINGQLVRAIRHPHTDRDKWLCKVGSMLKAIENDAPAHRSYQVLKQLHQILSFTLEFDKGNWAKAIELSEVLLPSNIASLNSRIRDYNYLDDKVVEVFPQVFKDTINAMTGLAQQGSAAGYTQPALRERLNALQQFLAAIPDAPPYLAQLISRTTI